MVVFLELVGAKFKNTSDRIIYSNNFTKLRHIQHKERVLPIKIK